MITKKQASILYGDGYKLVDKHGFIFEIKELSEEMMVVFNDIDKYSNIFINKIGVDYFILCRPYSQLTEEITHEGETFVPLEKLIKTHSLIDLSKCDFDCWHDEHDGKYIVNANDINTAVGRCIDAMYFDDNVFKFMNNDGYFSTLNPHQEIVDTFLSMHFQPYGIPDEYCKHLK